MLACGIGLAGPVWGWRDGVFGIIIMVAVSGVLCLHTGLKGYDVGWWVVDVNRGEDLVAFFRGFWDIRGTGGASGRAGFRGWGRLSGLVRIAACTIQN